MKSASPADWCDVYLSPTPKANENKTGRFDFGAERAISTTSLPRALSAQRLRADSRNSICESRPTTPTISVRSVTPSISSRPTTPNRIVPSGRSKTPNKRPVSPSRPVTPSGRPVTPGRCASPNRSTTPTNLSRPSTPSNVPSSKTRPAVHQIFTINTTPLLGPIPIDQRGEFTVPKTLHTSFDMSGVLSPKDRATGPTSLSATSPIKLTKRSPTSALTKAQLAARDLKIGPYTLLLKELKKENNMLVTSEDRKDRDIKTLMNQLTLLRFQLKKKLSTERAYKERRILQLWQLVYDTEEEAFQIQSKEKFASELNKSHELLTDMNNRLDHVNNMVAPVFERLNVYVNLRMLQIEEERKSTLVRQITARKVINSEYATALTKLDKGVRMLERMFNKKKGSLNGSPSSPDLRKGSALTLSTVSSPGAVNSVTDTRNSNGIASGKFSPTAESPATTTASSSLAVEGSPHPLLAKKASTDIMNKSFMRPTQSTARHVEEIQAISPKRSTNNLKQTKSSLTIKSGPDNVKKESSPRLTKSGSKVNVKTIPERISKEMSISQDLSIEVITSETATITISVDEVTVNKNESPLSDGDDGDDESVKEFNKEDEEEMTLVA